MFETATATLRATVKSPEGLVKQLFVLTVALSYVLGGAIPKGAVPFDRLDLIRNHIRAQEDWGLAMLDVPALHSGETQGLISE